MKYISEELANKVGALALDYTKEIEFVNHYQSSVGGTTINRNFPHNNLLCGIFFTQKETVGTSKEKGFHLNIMSNGDVFGRDFPYYDGDLELIPIYNQRKIFDLIVSA